jgi:hypothetical protein
VASVFFVSAESSLLLFICMCLQSQAEKILFVEEKIKVLIYRWKICLSFFKISPEAGLLNKGLMLSSSFRCDQIFKYEIYNFGHTLLCYLSWT